MSDDDPIGRFRQIHGGLLAYLARPDDDEEGDEDGGLVRRGLAALGDWPPDGWPRPAPGPAPRSVAIVGKAPDRYLAPWGMEGWEIWGLNDSEDAPPIEAHTRWFQLHPPPYLKRHYPWGLEELRTAWGAPRGVRLYMDRHYDVYPDSEPFPKADVEALTPHGRYHTSSFDWMLALAILEGFTTIGLFGVNLVTPPLLNGEPLSGRPCLEYWAGVAEGRGAEVVLMTTNTDIFHTVHLAHLRSTLQYGYDHEPGHDLGDGWRDLR